MSSLLIYHFRRRSWRSLGTFWKLRTFSSSNMTHAALIFTRLDLQVLALISLRFKNRLCPSYLNTTDTKIRQTVDKSISGFRGLSLLFMHVQKDYYKPLHAMHDVSRLETLSLLTCIHFVSEISKRNVFRSDHSWSWVFAALNKTHTLPSRAIQTHT
jgi:hypothetical protein